MRFVLRDGQPALDPTDPGLNLTDEQRAALADDREICLEAGAGAGKTHTLALRFVSLLVREAWTGDAPDRVLVLTFTEKAAEEMADRCRVRLGEVAAAAGRSGLPLPPEALRAWARNLGRMVATFDRARISTFHGFCAALLREFPAAGRTPPGAAVLDPLLAREAEQEALADAVEDWRTRRPDDVLRLLDGFGSRRALLRAAGAVVARRSLLADPLARAERGEPSLADRLRSAALGPEEVTAALRTRWLPAIELLLRLVAPSGGGPAAAAFREAAEAARTEGGGALEAAARLRSALAPWLTVRGTLRALHHPTVMGTRRDWPDERRHAQAKAALQALAERVRDAPEVARRARTLPTPADAALHAVLPVFAALCREVDQRLDAGLRARGELTFDALQDRAVAAVLEDDAVAATLRGRHRWLMVDEFQDTDARQWALIRRLGRDDPAVPEDRIFVVGDPKQAIYGFRGGDVTVFRAAADALGSGRLHLRRNFRSGPGLVRWFNAVFPSVFGAGDEPWEARWEPLVAGREVEGGSVALIEADEPAEAVADAVTGALAAGAGSVAVLLRARTRQDRYEQALRVRGIPYTVPSGVGFWSRPEIRDLGHALVAAALGDEIATLAWLRSPLGGLTDAEVHALGGAGIRALALGGPDAPEAPSRPARDAGDRFRAARAELHTLLPSAWLERRVDELRPALELDEPSGRALRNARRLVERLRPLDGRGASAVARFVRRALDAEEREGEAPPPGAAGVVLTTVHGAKGLEFDAVVVPELDARPAPDRSLVQVARLQGRWELGFDVDDPEAEIQGTARPGLTEALRQQLRAEADAEDRRLLYVACTRARDALVLIGRPVGDPDPAAFPTWSARLRATLPAETLRALPPSPPVSVAAPAPPPAPPFTPIPPVRAREVTPSAWSALPTAGPAAGPVGERARALAAVRGRVLHELLEDGDASPAALVRRWTAAARELGADAEELDRGARLLADAHARLAALPEVRRALAARGHRELAFRVGRGPVVLRGRIDRLWWDDDAHGWVVTDWKSGRPGDEAAVRQLLAYGWAASHLVAEPVVRGEIVWAASGVVQTVGPWSAGAFAPVEAWLDGLAADAAADGPPDGAPSSG